MKIYVGKDYQQMCRKAANLISAQIIMKPDCVLGLATGNTPIGVYQQLVEWYKKGDLDFSQVRTVNLDEYRGLMPENKYSYHYFMQEKLFSHVNMDQNNVFIPNGMEADCIKECARYNNVLSGLGKIDLQLLGLGHNAHIGFNEPCDFFVKDTHCVTLSPSTIEANSRLFDKGEAMPEQAYTMGIEPIMNAKKLLLLVSGEDKADILRQVLTGPITPKVPATILQLHKELIVITDRAAISSYTMSKDRSIELIRIKEDESFALGSHIQR